MTTTAEPKPANGWLDGALRDAGDASFDPRDDLLALVRRGGRDKDATGKGGSGADDPSDVYQDLMAREHRVLDTVDRVVNDAERNDGDRRGFLQLSLHEVGIRSIRVMRGLLDDLIEARSVRDVYTALMHPGRKVYIGVVLLLLALCVYFVDVTDR